MVFAAWTKASLAAAEAKRAATAANTPPPLPDYLKGTHFAQSLLSTPQKTPVHDAEYFARWDAEIAELHAQWAAEDAATQPQRDAEAAELEAKLVILRAADPVLMGRWEEIMEVLENGDDDEDDEEKGVPDRRRVHRKVLKLARRLGVCEA